MKNSPERRDTPSEGGPLFRTAVTDEQRKRWLGTVLLAPSLSQGVFLLFALVSAALVVALLVFGDYTRKERIGGVLVPQRGLIGIYAPEAGVVSELNVTDGAEVERGETLLVVSTERSSQAVGGTQQEIVRRLKSRRDSLRAERELLSRRHEQQRASQSSRLVALRLEASSRRQEVAVQRERADLAADTAQRLDGYRADGTVSEERWLLAENERLDQLARLRALERESASARVELLALQDGYDALPLERDRELGALAREIDALEQELAEAEARRRFVVPAPQGGVVTSVQLEPGARVSPDVPLFSILPNDSPLEARLFIPTRAIGFVEPGQTVLLRYRAFPYQKFGFHEGTVAEVARATVTPEQLPPELRAASAGAGGIAATYPITVDLAAQAVEAYGRSIALQPGMEIEADVLIETRRLIEWVLEPLYTLSGNLRG